MPKWTCTQPAAQTFSGFASTSVCPASGALQPERWWTLRVKHVPSSRPHEAMSMSQSTCSEPNHAAPLCSGFNPASLSATFGGPSHDGRLLLNFLAALKRHETLLEEIERASSTGGFCWHAATDKMTCTGEVYRIFELDAAVPVT